jgi:integrase
MIFPRAERGTAMKLNAHAIRTQQLDPDKSEAIFFDDELAGFGLRLRKHGSRSFVFQYKLGAKQRRMSLGIATALNVAAVRKSAERLHARVKLGEDPAADKAEAKAGAAKTFKAATADYLDKRNPDIKDKHGKPREGVMRSRSFRNLKRHLLRDAKPLHQLQLAKIKRADIAPVLTATSRDCGAPTANRVRTSLMSFFGWAVEQSLAETNPVIGTSLNKETSRDRVLLPAELRAIWAALPDDHFGSIMKLLALTGQRADEIASLGWSEIHGNMIVLPKERTKNSRPHVVPLSQAAFAIIEKQMARANGDGSARDLVFGIGRAGFSGWSNCKKRLAAKIKETLGKELPRWTPHDLRRTFATYIGGGLPAHELEKLKGHDREMASGLKIPPHVREAILNHVSGFKAGVAGVYDRSDYGPEKRTALDRWAEHLLAIVGDRTSNVTPIRA